MTAIIIYAAVFASVLLLTNLVVEHLVPMMFGRYNKWQGKRVRKVADTLEDSFIFLERKKMLYLTLSPLLLAGILFLLFRNPLGLLLGFGFGLALPGLLTNFIRTQRIKKFQSQLVDSLMILSSSLKGGLSLVQAIEVLCEEMPPPVQQEFNLILKENRWGVSLEESLRKLRKRVPIEEMNLLVSSVLVARETGGELTKVFSRLTATIRDNMKLKEKIATLTLQGRLQGVIMTILPFAFGFFIYKQNPDHFDIMIETDMGRKLLIGAFGMLCLGIYLIKRISTLRV
ncbi:type II secretion system F family protein [Candidatus Omnitrophota bacterium]